MQADARNKVKLDVANSPLTFASAARLLGASRSNLSRAVRGKISNPSLVSRYRDLVALRTRNTNPTPA